MQSIDTPKSKQSLELRANALAGLTLGQIAAELNRLVPANLQRDKGWVGQLLEDALGADAGTKAAPDFQSLGIELKTIPINAEGKPMESTFVSTIPLLTLSQYHWETCSVYKKLRHVLWFPVQADKQFPLADRVVGTPFFWQANAQDMAILRNDWQELSDKIVLGQLETITARHGVYLQVRPKGANRQALCQAIGPQGETILTLPRGFYLRRCFTEQLLNTHFA